MPTPTYTPLATVTLGSSAASVTFSNIPATYRDLVVVFNYQTYSLSYAEMRLNSDTGLNYSFVTMYANASTNSTANTYDRFYLSTPTIQSGTRVFGVSQLMDYSATDKHTTLLNRLNYTNGSGVQVVEQQASRWANTSAVNTIQLLGNFSTGATLALYGIAS
jgi:hypothetical protein